MQMCVIFWGILCNLKISTILCGAPTSMSIDREREREKEKLWNCFVIPIFGVYITILRETDK